MITDSTELVFGIEYEGKVHKQLMMRTATIADSVAAVSKGVAAEKTKEMELRVFKAAEQIVAVGDIPADVITADVIFQLPDLELERILDLQDALEKKQACLSLPSSRTDS
jgi:hypothetical protein